MNLASLHVPPHSGPGESSKWSSREATCRAYCCNPNGKWSSHEWPWARPKGRAIGALDKSAQIPTHTQPWWQPVLQAGTMILGGLTSAQGSATSSKVKDVISPGRAETQSHSLLPGMSWSWLLLIQTVIACRRLANTSRADYLSQQFHIDIKEERQKIWALRHP